MRIFWSDNNIYMNRLLSLKGKKTLQEEQPFAPRHLAFSSQPIQNAVYAHTCTCAYMYMRKHMCNLDSGRSRDLAVSLT